MPLLPIPIPLQDAIARPRRKGFKTGEDPLEGRITDSWQLFLSNQSQIINTTASGLAVLTLQSQGAAIAASDLNPGNTSTRLYRVTYAAQITQAASVSSSLTVTFSWTSQGNAQTKSGAAITGNTLADNQSGTLLLPVDGATPITYSTSYASVGGTSMEYLLAIVLEQIGGVGQ